MGPTAFPTPPDVAIDDHNVFQPDIVVLSRPVEEHTTYVGVPLLAVEVLSPSTRDIDRTLKADRLLEVGVQEVWLVEPSTRTIEIRTASGRHLFRGDEAAASDALPAFRIVPAELFTPAR